MIDYNKIIVALIVSLVAASAYIIINELEDFKTETFNQGVSAGVENVALIIRTENKIPVLFQQDNETFIQWIELNQVCQEMMR